MKLINKPQVNPEFEAAHGSCRVFVANNSTHRKVLIVADEPAIKNLLHVGEKTGQPASGGHKHRGSPINDSSKVV